MPPKYNELFETLLEKVNQNEVGHQFYSTVQAYSDDLNIEMKKFCEVSISISKKVGTSKNKAEAVKDFEYSEDPIVSQICHRIYNKNGKQLIRPLTELPIFRTYKDAIKKSLKTKQYRDLAILFENVDIHRFLKHGLNDFIEKLPTANLKILGLQFFEEIRERVIIYDKSKYTLILDEKIRSSKMKMGEADFPFNITTLCDVLFKDWGVKSLNYLSLANNCFVKQDLKYIRKLIDTLDIKVLNLSGNRILINKDEEYFEDIIRITKNVNEYTDFTLNYFQSDPWALRKIKDAMLLEKFIWILPEFVRSKIPDDPMNAGWLKLLEKDNMSDIINAVYYAHVEYKTKVVEFNLSKFC
eukprot:NODE_179_length_13932_cov_0.652064.p4 type:complete len:355 gc:universal NODE_179_length_13932_cov_0.652064:2759-3823(+)